MTSAFAQAALGYTDLPQRATVTPEMWTPVVFILLAVVAAEINVLPPHPHTRGVLHPAPTRLPPNAGTAAPLVRLFAAPDTR